MQSQGKKNKQQVVKEVGGCVRMRGQEERGSGGRVGLQLLKAEAPSRHPTGIQKQNLTDQEKGVISSLSVCEGADFFKTRW